MKDFIINYKDQIIQISTFLTLPFLVFLISLGSVYLFGRMFNVVKSNTRKNVLAFIVMTLCYVFYFYFLSSLNIYDRIWFGLIYLALSIIFYTLIGFKLYTRVDNFLDKKLASDDDKKEIKSKKKK